MRFCRKKSLLSQISNHLIFKETNMTKHISNHKNNTVSGKLNALALRGKRARQFIAINLFSGVVLTSYVI